MGAVAGSTVTSGLLGVASNVLTAAYFGRGPATDAFFMAQSLLRIFGKFFQTGPLRQIVMPIFSEACDDDRAQAQRYASNIITTTGIVLGLVTLGLWVVSPWIVAVIAPGFQGAQLALTIRLTRLFVPIIFCTILLNLLTSFLHTFQRFGFAEWMARLPSAVMILALLWGAGRWPIDSLVWALIIGSLIQVVVVAIGVARLGLSYSPVLDWRQPELRTTWRRLSPFFLSSAAVQAQLIVHRIVTSTQPTGTLSALSYADRIVQFLDALISVVPLVLFPQLIQDALKENRVHLRQRLERVALVTSLVTFPALVALLVFSQPAVELVFQHGRFDGLATQETALALGWLLIGLFAWTVWGLCKTTAYAVQRPGLVNATVIVVCGIASLLTLVLGPRLGLTGLAISSSAVPFLMSAGYLWLLRRDVPAIHRIVWNGPFGRVVLAALGMGGFCWVLRETIWSGWFAHAGALIRLIGLGVLSLSGAAGYWMWLVVFRVEARHELPLLIRRAVAGSHRQTDAPVVVGVKEIILSSSSTS